MNLIRTMLVLGWGGLALSALAQAPRSTGAAPPATPAASATVAGSVPMAIEGEWRGPFQDTKVLKMVDTDEGVACYFYVPHNVPSTSSCSARNDCVTHYPSGVGTMSCVKVRSAPTPAKPPAKTKAKP